MTINGKTVVSFFFFLVVQKYIYLKFLYYVEV